MEKQHIKELLEFILNSFRAQLAVQTDTLSNGNNCPFDFQNFLIKWKSIQQQQQQQHASSISNKTTKTQFIITLNTIITQGLLDSILPYLISNLNQTTTTTTSKHVHNIRRTSPTTTTTTASTSGNQIIGLKYRSDPCKLEQQLLADDCEIIIHVCDETRGIRQDFQFQQSTLTKEMGYFTHVTVKGQKLKDLDISVHCDLNVFDWLIKWTQQKNQILNHENHHEIISNNNIIKLTPENVIGIIVSGDFLQMPSLVSECLDFIHQNIELIIIHSPNLSCMSEILVKKLGGYFRSIDLENRIIKLDRTDRITSRLYIQHILGLNVPEQDLDFMTTHIYASTESLFKCEICGQLLINSIASKIGCVVTRVDSKGRLFFGHVKDMSWTLNNYIRELKRELKTWRRVYWRLWGTVNFFKCINCNFYFSGRGLHSCRFHSDNCKNPTLLSTQKIEEKLPYSGMSRNIGRSVEKNREGALGFTGGTSMSTAPSIKLQNHTEITTGQPYRKYHCCLEMSYKYSPHPRISGCEKRDHLAYDELAENWMILNNFRELILDENFEIPIQKLSKKIQLRPPGDQSLNDLMCPPKPSKYSIFMRTSMGQNTTGVPNSSSSTETDESGTEPMEMNRMTSNNSTSTSNKNAHRIRSQLDRSKDNYSWIWNSDLSTRYNQDMQREKEEIYMVNLAAVLAQRIPLESSKFQFLRRRAPKEDIGGCFTKLEHDFLS